LLRRIDGASDAGLRLMVRIDTLSDVVVLTVRIVSEYLNSQSVKERKLAPSGQGHQHR